ncbi:MAG: deoxynucleotide monophosphate kinase family protein [Mycobacteriaceae bacterium]
MASNSDARKRHEELAMRWEAAKAMETTIIGLSGWAQSGKDSTGNVLAEKYGYEKLAFAEKLRSVARASNPLVEVTYTALSPCPGLYGGDAVTAEYVYELAATYSTSPEYAFDAYEWLKANTTYREFLQNLGTAVRDHLGELTWVNAALDQAEDGGKYVVTDVRYQNEARAIQARGGQVWRVRRADHHAANDHISEHDLDDFTFDRVLSLPDFGDDLDALYPAIAELVGITFGIVR